MNDIESVADWIALACLLTGAFLCLTAGVGLLRFPDVLSRMHAGTKPQVMGVLLIMVGGAIRLSGWSATWMLLLVAVFQLITAPVNAHMVSRIAYRRGHVGRESLFVDELGVAARGAEVTAGEEGRRGDQPADAPIGDETEPQVDEDDGAGDQAADEPARGPRG
ncbi:MULTISPECIES: monovalent cation/H(+) antiporter subunit G [unclassified Modestobacter]|uniref:monovalent cation/H(+) antiporter subunit G n=1 Tax=unclassified Modestobacter TaxID=2643866 RepID=UPI0022AA390B|nr:MULTISPECIES: monovalent cation/H(+) antiporter subunit G [unclassified Modestobacter]MCZ2813527.1 monovalent cation/H(+) antiporter subunit G [Modestobacter sp. VKM Ac-2979]MCZ2842281.1 monovalent cation/H(+) antiporter subunit G [Modestobacter sp. VKM Ac-2980]MCZ2846684.1 monovalent cation/H(+) antiporter subunit G [Modestobacter sp. VKM Ac-2978]